MQSGSWDDNAELVSVHESLPDSTVKLWGYLTAFTHDRPQTPGRRACIARTQGSRDECSIYRGCRRSMWCAAISRPSIC